MNEIRITKLSLENVGGTGNEQTYKTATEPTEAGESVFNIVPQHSIVNEN